jgi:hypothetical protein
MKQIAAANNL